MDNDSLNAAQPPALMNVPFEVPPPFPVAFAMYDPVLARIPVFRPLPKGGSRAALELSRPYGNDGQVLTITRAVQNVQTQTTLLTVLALARMRGISVSSDKRDRWPIGQELKATGLLATAPYSVVEISWADLALAHGYALASGKTKKLLHENLARLSDMWLFETQAERIDSTRLLAYQTPDRRRVVIALNARFHQTLFAGPYAYISLAERRQLPSDTAKAVHVYLSAEVWTAKRRLFLIDRLGDRIYGEVPTGVIGRSRRAAVKEALRAIGSLAGWSCELDGVRVQVSRQRVIDTHGGRNASTTIENPATPVDLSDVQKERTPTSGELSPTLYELSNSSRLENPKISKENEEDDAVSISCAIRESSITKASSLPGRGAAHSGTDSPTAGRGLMDLFDHAPPVGGRIGGMTRKPVQQCDAQLDWLRLAGIEKVDFMVRRSSGDAIQRLDVDGTSVDKLLVWFRHENARDGADIYVRAARGHSWPVVFLDDVRPETALRIAANYNAAVVETSFKSCHVFLQVDSNLDEDMRCQVQKRLAGLVDGNGVLGDPASVSGEHFGRLAGFKNRKPQRDNWVNLIWTSTNLRAFPLAVLTLERGTSSDSKRGTPAGFTASFVREGGDTSASGQDWRRTMSDLEAGKSTDETTAKLERSAAARGKTGAASYARRTVSKARAKIQQRRTSSH